jgi:hypothetical protein
VSEDTLVHVARLPSTNAGSTPDALWLDTQSLRFLVVPVANGDDHEPPATPVEDYLAAHPDPTQAVRAALTERFRDLPVPMFGARARFLDRKKNLNADELIARITPDNCHPETGGGPPGVVHRDGGAGRNGPDSGSAGKHSVKDCLEIG